MKYFSIPFSKVCFMWVKSADPSIILQYIIWVYTICQFTHLLVLAQVMSKTEHDQAT